MEVEEKMKEEEQEEIPMMPVEDPQAAYPLSEDSMPWKMPEPVVVVEMMPEPAPEPEPEKESPTEPHGLTDEDSAAESLHVPASVSETEPEIERPPEPEVPDPETPVELLTEILPEPDLVAETEVDAEGGGEGGVAQEDGIPRAYYGDVKAKLSRNLAR